MLELTNTRQHEDVTRRRTRAWRPLPFDLVVLNCSLWRTFSCNVVAAGGEERAVDHELESGVLVMVSAASETIQYTILFEF